MAANSDSPVLRVVLDDVPAPERAAAWALFDAQGRRLRSGHGVPATWPDAPRRECVLAASRVRLACLALPPMPADRLAAAAAFALEDSFARPASEQLLQVAARDAQGRVLVTATSRALVSTLARDFARTLAEPALAPQTSSGHWRWLPSAGGETFARGPDGAAFAVSHPRATLELPTELALALAARASAVPTPVAVDVAFAVTDAQLEAWSAAAGLPFRRTEAWQWDHDGAAFDRLPDLAHDTTRDDATTASTHGNRNLHWAGAIAGVALLGALIATFAQWAWLRMDEWRTQRAIVAVAADAGISGASDAEGAAAALTRRWSEARHRAGGVVPGDALPLLARAAPALGALPAGALKSAVFSPGQWTFDLGTMDPATFGTFERQLAATGLVTIAAANAGGTRLRATLAPGQERP